MSKKISNFAAEIKNTIVAMSERDKIIEQERKGVLELMLKKAGLTRKQLTEDLLGIWMAGNNDLLSEREKKQFPHLVW